jgi:hypothetical protein
MHDMLYAHQQELEDQNLAEYASLLRVPASSVKRALTEHAYLTYTGRFHEWRTQWCQRNANLLCKLRRFENDTLPTSPLDAIDETHDQAIENMLVPDCVSMHRSRSAEVGTLPDMRPDHFPPIDIHHRLC